MAITALLKLAGFTNELRYVDIAHQALAQMQSMVAQYPLGFGQWLQVLAHALSKPREIAIVGDPGSVDTQALLNVVRSGYRPFQVAALGPPHGQRPGHVDVQLAQARQLPSNAADPVSRIAAVPLLQVRGLVEGQATAYVCRDSACQVPVTESGVLQSTLETG